MFVGHHSVGLAAKRIQSRVSLFILLTAAMLADIVYSIFLIARSPRAAGIITELASKAQGASR
jgi:hypothetical protein